MTPWKPNLGPDGLPTPRVFLSASVPSLDRDARFLRGDVEPRLMVRVIETRVRDAIASFVVSLLRAGGQLIFGGQPDIVPMVAAAAANFSAEDGQYSPILLYQSEYFLQARLPVGREELEATHLAKVHWVPVDRLDAAKKFRLDSPFLQDGRAFDNLPTTPQTPPPADATLEDALTVLRVVMCLHRSPQAIFSMGGMEGISAESQIFHHLRADTAGPGEFRALHGRESAGRPMAFALRSTYGAVSGLRADTTDFIDEAASDGQPLGPAQTRQLLPTPERATIKRQLTDRIRYDGIMQKFVQRIAAGPGDGVTAAWRESAGEEFRGMAGEG